MNQNTSKCLNENGTSRGPVKWQRVLLKVSGEAFAGDHEQNIDPKVTMAIAREVADVTRPGIEVDFLFILYYCWFFFCFPF
ncbi:hypothetical protein L6452_08354 [Arctium lappa]|uniref:Uncharacterized protein n=1 Tax=Arctium lappa TaxID=4217 RepID=A0ACB9DH98_ARCLA|nr:hypothetical protein L6452_08354 [Arctium lappa]